MANTCHVGTIKGSIVLLIGVFLNSCGPSQNKIITSFEKTPVFQGLSIATPFDSACFPPEFPPPTFSWDDRPFPANQWLISISFQGISDRMISIVKKRNWVPREDQWEIIKKKSLERYATIVVLGIQGSILKKVVSSGKLSIITSKDSVLAPLFYREVNLPFAEAVKDPSYIRWHFGAVSLRAQPPVVLTNLPVCGNCHSFSSDGSLMGMDIDYANDKGSYGILPILKKIIIDKQKIMTWMDYKREDGKTTFGLLSQVSPDGKFVVSTVKDRSVFVPKPDISFSQLFFPVKGILVVYTIQSRTFQALPGADDEKFVQSNASWSPDGKQIVFIRSNAYNLKTDDDKILLSPEDCAEFVKQGKPFLFDIYRIPFNGGKGGTAMAVPGASHNGMSNYFPRYSPEGKWIVFCKAKSYSLLQPDSKLFILPSTGGEPREMRCNTRCMNSWHSFTPNGKWLVFSSKAYSPYTQLFITHIDDQGHDTRPVVLEHFTSSHKAANIPEFVNARPDAIQEMKIGFLDDSYYIRAVEQFIQGYDFQGAKKACYKALEFNPDNTKAHYYLGNFYYVENKDLEARKHYEHCLRFDSSFADAHGNLGAVLERMGFVDEAIKHYYTALRYHPQDALTRANLGMALESIGKIDEAKAQYTLAIKLNPSLEEVKHRLNAMKGR
jgi:hypothetical protein